MPDSRWQRDPREQRVDRQALTHFSQRQDPDLQNEAIVERWWVASQGPVHLRPTFHDCGQAARGSKGQRLVTCFLLGFRADSGNSYLLSEIIFFFKSSKSKASEAFFFSLRFFYLGQLKWANQ